MAEPTERNVTIQALEQAEADYFYHEAELDRLGTMIDFYTNWLDEHPPTEKELNDGRRS